MKDKEQNFPEDLVTSYPQSGKKISVEVKPYNLLHDADFNENLTDEESEEARNKAQTTHISPHGMAFHGAQDYPLGTLLKINVALPNYWERKQRFVEYSRIDTPNELKILAKVVKTEEIGKRGKKKLVLVQTVNIDEVDEKVLCEFLKEGK